MCRVMRKTEFANAITKTHISSAVTAQLICVFVLATRIVQFVFFLNPKFQASSLFASLCQTWSGTLKTGFSRLAALIRAVAEEQEYQIIELIPPLNESADQNAHLLSSW